MSDANLELQGMTPDVLYANLKAAGVNEVDAGLLVSGWIFHNFGNVQRTFAYGQSFDAVDTNCGAATFTRSFVHSDWVDGESVVQAQQSPGEEGFNVRFHKIEADIDGLSAEIAKLYACVAEMRSSLHDRLAEIAAELNRLDADTFQCCAPKTLTPGGTFYPPYGSLVNNAQYVGVSKFGDQTVAMWNTAQGMYMLPAVNPVVGDPLADGRVQAAASFAKYVTENPDIGKSFTAAFTVGDFVAKYGDARLDNGLTVSQTLSGLPSNAQFASLDALTTGVTQQSAAAIKSAAGQNVGSVIAAAFGTQVSALNAVSVDRLSSVPAAAQTALAQAGFGTLGKLATANLTDVTAALQKSGIAGLGAGDAASIIATAKTISAIGGQS
jgi:hypothetical protein